jgi:hypothetical protein
MVFEVRYGMCALKQFVFYTYIVLMSIQLVAIEGYALSVVKVAAMALSAFFIIIFGYTKRLSNAVVYGLFNVIIMSVCAILASPLVAWDRIGYRMLYILMFICVYDIIYEGNINIQMAKRLCIILIVLYGIDIILQYFLHFAGFQEFPLLNHYGTITMTGIYKPNGLSIEPSHSARIMTIIYWSIIKLTEIENKRKQSFIEFVKAYPITSALFYISMLSMGSATALIGVLLILLVFFYQNYALFLIGLIGFILIMNMQIDNPQVRRLQIIFNSLFSDDTISSLKRKESSGAIRILPILNTFRMDIFAVDTWIGQGSVSQIRNFLQRTLSERRYIGDVTSFGLLSYLASLLFVYKCCIRRFLSMETVLFFFLATFSVGSIYYTWLMLILFCLVQYFESEQVCDMGNRNIEDIN